MLKKILLVLALVILIGIAGACLLISQQPSTFTIERSAVIAASPAEVFAQVSDLKAWDGWSPWKELDPNPKTAISTPSAGRGATLTWDGNDEIGEGTLTIMESKPDELVELEQAFVRPMQDSARMKFTFAPQGDATKVTWRMYGEHDFVGKAMCLVMDMDAMLGPKFEQGLVNMKKRVETKEPANSGPETKGATKSDAVKHNPEKNAATTPATALSSP